MLKLPSKLALLVALALLGPALACRSPYSAVISAGPQGAMTLTANINGRVLEVEGREGRLLLNGSDAGPLEHGDLVQLTSEGAVFVNGKPRDIAAAEGEASAE